MVDQFRWAQQDDIHMYMFSTPVLRVTTDCAFKVRSWQHQLGSMLDSWTNRAL